ncbi:hypothetical protein BCF74_11927 [Knoellia remsis]|uniref:Uncharacterized protein n=1 Tax=Knoellia remsis TaxID=407159 RepID=A0A2T0UEE5_9MICO|nr:hypothetical protein BCF74_11927 [Knoellia remsis]
MGRTPRSMLVSLPHGGGGISRTQDHSTIGEDHT